jgi:ribulose-phosphate 3-epimerase
MQAGVALNPHTNINVLEDTINDIDLVCIMSVNPGFGGQKFIENTYSKVEQLKALIERKGAATKIEIDGGVTNKNAKQLVDAGADVLVAGSFVFGSENQLKTVKDLKALANS